MSDDNGSDRLARIESKLDAVAAAVETRGATLDAVAAAVEARGATLEAHGAALEAIGTAVKAHAETTALGFQTLTDMMRVLDARMTELTTRFDHHLRGHAA